MSADVSKCHQRMDQEVDAIHNRFTVREGTVRAAAKSCKG